MAQGDPSSTGYAKGTPDTYLASHATSRVTAGAGLPIDAQDVTHALLGPFDAPRVTIVTAGTRVPLSASSLKARAVLAQVAEGSSGTIVIGGATVVAALATRRGLMLPAPGDAAMLECNDLADVYVDSTASGDVVTLLYWTL